MYYYQFEDIAAVGHRGYAVAAPALVALFVNGQVQRYKLPRLKVERIRFR